jgi:hypothetical protein
MTNVTRLIRSLEKVARDQQRVIENLRRLLSGLNNGRRAPAGLAKRLRCPHCSRRFALPVHLGRNMRATHHRKLARMKKAA